MRKFVRGLSVALTGVALAAGAHAGVGASGPDPEPYVRIVEEDSGAKVLLQLAIRTFRPTDGEGPEIAFAGVVHIAEPGFYSTYQEFLDRRDVVLFESVKPAGTGDVAHERDAGNLTAEDRRRITEGRLRFLATVLAKHRQETGEIPGSLEELAEAHPGHIGGLLAVSRVDAWSNAILFEPGSGARGFDLISLGADGDPGGEGADADLAFSDQPALADAEISEDRGIQGQLATALNLVFQLDAMSHDGANWRNSDLSIDQVQDRLDVGGEDSDQLFAMLDGSSLTAKLAGFLLRLIGASETMSAMARLTIMEMLSRADELLAQMPGEMGRMMDVIIHDRNDVVIADLERLLAEEPELGSIAVIYGAGHMPDLERRLVEELGYEPAEDRWVNAISVSAEQVGMTPAQMTQMRRMMHTALEQQLRTLQRSR